MSVWSLGKVEDMVTIAKDDSVKDETKQALVKKKVKLIWKNFWENFWKNSAVFFEGSRLDGGNYVSTWALSLGVGFETPRKVGFYLNSS